MIARSVFVRTAMRIFAIMLAIAVPGSVHAQNGGPVRLTADNAQITRFFDRYMQEAIQDYDLPGGAIVVVRDGQTILQKGYGKADIATGRAVDPERDIFRAASISKLLVWILVMQEVERGRIDLDRDINAYLDFDIPPAFGRPITMRHLMTHSAGFADRFHGVLSSDLSKPLGTVLRENLPQRVYAPGETVAYSNYGAALAGHIVQRLDGRSWEGLVQERLFRPLGMQRSSVSQPVSDRLKPALVSTYRYGADQPSDFRVTPLPPMGSLSASAADMGRLLAMFARQGQGEKGRVLTPQSVAEMARLKMPLAAGLDSGFGLGTLSGTYRGVRFAGHAGNMTSLVTDMEVLPELGLGWYYVFNGPGFNDSARGIRSKLLIAAIDGLTNADKAPSPQAAIDSSFEGSFVSTRRQRRGPMMFNALMDTLEVYRERDGGLATLNSGIARYWTASGPDVWRDEKTGIELRVERDADGNVQRVGSWLIYPAAAFEPAPAYVGWVEMVLKGSLLLFLIGGIAKLGFYLRDRFRAKRGPSRELHSSRTSRLNKLTRAAFWMFFICLAGWAIFGITIATDPANLLDAPASLRFALAALAVATAPLAAMALVGTIHFMLAGFDRVRSLVVRLPVAIAACGIAWLFYRFDFINPLTNW